MVQYSHDVELTTYSPGLQEAQIIRSADEVLPSGLVAVVVGYRQSVRRTAQWAKTIVMEPMRVGDGCGPWRSTHQATQSSLSS